MSRAMEGLLAPSELFQRHCSRPVKIIIRVPRYTILSLAEGYANFRYVAFVLFIKLKKPSFPFKLYNVRYILAGFQSPQESAH